MKDDKNFKGGMPLQEDPSEEIVKDDGKTTAEMPLEIVSPEDEEKEVES